MFTHIFRQVLVLMAKTLVLHHPYKRTTVETTNWLAAQAWDITKEFGVNLLWGSFLYGLAGLIIGGLLVIFLHRSGAFRRRLLMWHWLTKVQYAVIPFGLMFIMSAYGSVSSVHGTVDGWVDATTDEMETFAAAYIPEMQRLAETVASRADGAQEAIGDIAVQAGGFEGSWWAEGLYAATTEWIINFVLDQIGLEQSVTGLADLAQPENIAQLNAMTFTGLGDFLKTGLATTYVSGFYWAIYVAFAVFALAVLSEHLLHWLFQKIFYRKPAIQAAA